MNAFNGISFTNFLIYLEKHWSYRDRSEQLSGKHYLKFDLKRIH
jgi:hypothetical protein